VRDPEALLLARERRRGKLEDLPRSTPREVVRPGPRRTLRERVDAVGDVLRWRLVDVSR